VPVDVPVVPAGTVLRSSVSQPVSRSGAPVVVSGRLVRADDGRLVPGQQVVLQQRTAAAPQWRTVLSLRTSASGHVTTTRRPTSSVQYRWVLAGSSAYAAAQSPVLDVRVPE
jgi:hypothetical protein